MILEFIKTALGIHQSTMVSETAPLPVIAVGPGGAANTDPVKVIGSHSATLTLTATGVGVAAPCTVVRVIVDDKGAAASFQINDNAAAASGTQYGPHKVTTDGQVIEYGIHMAAGAFITIAGGAKFTIVYKADP